jgi:hypothetical protein
MIPAAPHTHPLLRWHHAAIALAVGVQALALARVSPWLHPAWCAVLAVAVGASALPVIATRTVAVALAARLAATGAALAVAGVAIGAMVSHGWTVSLYPRAHPAFNLAAVGFWLWALHAPLTMSRWWVGARPAQDGALEVAEPLGVSLLATAVALTAQNPELAWSTTRGTAYSTGLCLALAVGLLGWSWVAQARRRAWMRRVVAGADPTWELMDADASATADPWTHSGDGAGAPRMLRVRGDGEHYRAAGVRVPVARVGPGDERAWRVRRGLHVVALLWGCALVNWGAWKLLHFWPKDYWGAVVDAMAAVRVGSDPCVVDSRRGERPTMEYEVMISPPTSIDVISDVMESVSVTPSGSVRMPRGSDTERFGTWCIAPATARRWLDEAGPRGLSRTDERVRSTPELLGPVVCERGRWCSITWGEHTESGEDAQVQAVNICTLQRNGWFHCEEGREHHSGRVRPAAAQALIETTERFAASQRVVRTSSLPALFVRVDGSEVSRAMEFPRSREIGRALRHRLWPTS